MTKVFKFTVDGQTDSLLDLGPDPTIQNFRDFILENISKKESHLLTVKKKKE